MASVPGPPTERSAEFVVVGVNHRTGTAALRERLFVEEAALPELLERLRAAGIAQAVALSTCDRIEVQAAHDDAATASDRIAEVLAGQAGVAPAALAAQTYRLSGAAAVRQILAVAASLDSVVIGEPQVLGQVKASHRLARAAGMVGSELEACLRAAYATAKRVRRETAIGERAVSIAAAAAELARSVQGDLGRCGALLIGAGEIGELMVEQLRRAGLARLTVAHPSAPRAERIAHRLGCHHIPLDEVGAALPAADVVVAALGSGRHVVTAPMVGAALKARRQRPVLLIDAAVPGDIEPAVGGLDEAFLYDLEDLERVAMQGRATRVAATEAAWAIVDEAVAAFLRERAERVAVPAVVALRRHFESLRAEVLAGTGDDAAEATRRLINRLLHDPSEALRRMAGEAAAEAAAGERLLRRLFGFADPDDEEERE